MAKRGLKNEKYIKNLTTEGSTALKPKNDFGVNVFDKKEDTSGLIAGKLIRPRYNQEELLKSVDTEIDELIPRTKPDLPATVLRETYNDALADINDLTSQVESLESLNNTLLSNIEALNSTTESLLRQIDGLTISKVATDEQLNTTQQSFSTSQSDLQVAIQNSTQEAIQRVSLTARNQSLSQEVDLLREQLFGRTAQIAAGADSLSETVTINNLNKGGGDYEIYATAVRKSKGGFQQFKSGEKFEIVNSGTEDETVRFVKKDGSGYHGWFSINVPNSTQITGGKQFTVTAGSTVIVTLKPNESSINGKRPTGWGKTRNYDAKVVVKIGENDEIQYNTRLRKARKPSKL